MKEKVDQSVYLLSSFFIQPIKDESLIKVFIDSSLGWMLQE